tara:strand:- start:242 stop:649 length:408 start_codon:yes stop_codon:yes gene_type:complete
MNSANNIFGNVIYSYTRAQAIEDGELIDVSETARETGFTISVAVTRSVWSQYIEWTTVDNDKQSYQNESGRLWDVLWMLYLACKRGKGESCLHYGLHVIPRNGRSKKPALTKLKSVISGGDEGEPVITIMLPSED